MPASVCLKCVHADWLRTSTGRLHPSGDGRCTYEVVLPTLPMSKQFYYHPRTVGGFINRNDSLHGDKTCPCRTEATNAD